MGYEIIRKRNDGVQDLLTTLDAEVFPGLSGFHLEFMNSDHHIHDIRVGERTADNSFRVGFGDGDGADPQRLWAMYKNLQVSGIHHVNGESLAPNNHQVSMPMPPVPPDHLVVLSGFSLRMPERKNNHVKWFSIAPDIRGREASMQVIFMDNDRRGDSFRCDVWFAYVPHARIAATTDRHRFFGYHSDGFDFTAETTREKERPGDALLSGFSFEFFNGDHHLRKISIDPSNRNSFALAFTDDERVNKVRARLDYVIMEDC